MIKNLVKHFMGKIKLLKNKGISWYKYYDLQDEIDKDNSNNYSFFKNIYKKYVEICQEKKCNGFRRFIT